MTRFGRFAASPFGVAVFGCLLLAGWALLSGGVLDGPIAREVRSSSVYVAPGAEVDEPAAERIIGNRRLVVAFLEPGTDFGEVCDTVGDATEGTVMLLLAPAEEGGEENADDYDHYGCSRLPDGDDENFGKSVVAETMIANGIDQFVDDPLSALKVVAVNYDLLVRAGIVPDGARTISPSLPRFLLAGAALGAVLVGSTLAYLGARRIARLTADHREKRDRDQDERGVLNARAAVLAERIIGLDRRYARSRDRKFRTAYQALAAEYATLVADITAGDAAGTVDPILLVRVDDLTDRCARLAGVRP